MIALLITGYLAFVLGFAAWLERGVDEQLDREIDD